MFQMLNVDMKRAGGDIVQ